MQLVFLPHMARFVKFGFLFDDGSLTRNGFLSTLGSLAICGFLLVPGSLRPFGFLVIYGPLLSMPPCCVYDRDKPPDKAP